MNVHPGNFACVFHVLPWLRVGMELVTLGAARLHLFFPGSPLSVAVYDYTCALDALRAGAAMMLESSPDPGGPWHRLTVLGVPLEHRPIH